MAITKGLPIGTSLLAELVGAALMVSVPAALPE